MRDLKIALANETDYFKVLSSLKISQCNASIRHCPTSVIKVLLSLNEVQGEIVELLLNRLKYLSERDTLENVQQFNLIVQQFTDFRNIHHKIQFTNTLIEILAVTKGTMREQAVKLIDILVSKSRQSYAIERLLELVDNKDELFKASFIDVFMKLNLDEEILSRLRIKMLDYLNEEAQKKVICLKFY